MKFGKYKQNKLKLSIRKEWKIMVDRKDVENHDVPTICFIITVIITRNHIQ